MPQHHNTPVLYQFRLSMFPEKARWALDYKGIPHIRRNFLPGPHVPQALVLSGKTQVPFLRDGQRWLRSSNEILQWAEQRETRNSLIPTDPQQRDLVWERIQQFDIWGAHVRRALFSEFLADAGYAAEAFAQGKSAMARGIYRSTFPLTRIAMKLSMNIQPKATAASLETTQRAMDQLAEWTANQDYLVGEQFTAADLTAATCMHCVCAPKQYPATFPEPQSAQHQRFLDRWFDHPATAWIRRIYSQHRPASAAIAEYD